MIRELRQENKRLPTALHNKILIGNGAKSEAAGDELLQLKKEVKTLRKINDTWKQDFERLGMRYKMLHGEKRQLEEEGRYLKEFAKKLTERRIFLESENQKLAAVADARQCKIG